MRVVLDANIIISGLISGRGLPNQILQLWRQEAFMLVMSPDILQEIFRVLQYPKLRKLHRLADDEVQLFVTLLERESELVTPKNRIDLSKDDSDNRYLECAVAGGARYLVTGDKKHLLGIEQHEGVCIVSAAVFITLFGM